jgi:DMSO reductase anchor subunit
MCGGEVMAVQWPLVFFTLLTGLGVSAFSCVAVTEWLDVAESIRMQGAVTALVAMALGGGISVLHLSHPFRTYHISKHFDTGMGKEMLLIGITGSLVLLYIIILGGGLSAQARRVVASLGLISSIALAFEMGAIYVLPARPAWNTWFWPFVYAASAAVTGLFTIYIWAAALDGRVGEAVLMGINKATLIALITQGGTLLAYMFFLLEAPYKDPRRRATRLLAGDMSFPFWGGVVIAGLALPIGMTLYLQAMQGAHAFLAVAIVGLIGALIGAITIRALMYTLGSEADPIL